jgi:hypothetical protein
VKHAGAREGAMSERGARTKRVIVMAAGVVWAALVIALAIVEAISTAGDGRSACQRPGPTTS